MQEVLAHRDYLMPDGRFARFEFGVSVIVICPSTWLRVVSLSNHLRFVICILLFLYQCFPKKKHAHCRDEGAGTSQGENSRWQTIDQTEGVRR